MFDSYIIKATAEVFESMIMMEATPGDKMTGEGAGFEADFLSMIGLAGDMRGCLALYFPSRVARAVTGNMLGMEEETVDDEDVKDAIGEIANMIAGGFKTFLIQDNKKISLSTPTIVSGSGVKTSGMSRANSFILPFETPSGKFRVELKFIQE